MPLTFVFRLISCLSIVVRLILVYGWELAWILTIRSLGLPTDNQHAAIKTATTISRTRIHISLGVNKRGNGTILHRAFERTGLSYPVDGHLASSIPS